MGDSRCFRTRPVGWSGRGGGCGTPPPCASGTTFPRRPPASRWRTATIGTGSPVPRRRRTTPGTFVRTRVRPASFKNRPRPRAARSVPCLLAAARGGILVRHRRQPFVLPVHGPLLQQRSKAGRGHHALSRSEALLARGGAAAVSILPVVRGRQFEIAYGHYFQSTSFGGAHVLQAGYTMPY